MQAPPACRHAKEVPRPLIEGTRLANACSFPQGRNRCPPEENRRPAQQGSKASKSLLNFAVELHRATVTGAPWQTKGTMQAARLAATCISFSTTGLAAHHPGNARSCSIRGDAEQCVANFLRFLTASSPGPARPAPCNVNASHYQPGPSSSAKPSVMRSCGHMDRRAGYLGFLD